ncbi:VOC family protein [Shewanella youngdeokensis]|uniref:VOC family protein n=1 Tax=Shewanella youngdeokensis TaxID=2999068 RepID=A0ABZ0K2V9_9GAMM|nr:VOC family protein [Shewanella sp. DAU334]
MFSHVMIGADDVQESKRFYDAILGAMGYDAGVIDDKGRCFYFTNTGVFAISKPINGESACHGNGSTIGFSADTPATVDAWHLAGTKNGGVTCENPPGVRELPLGNLYAAYLRDPAGNKICAIHRYD